MNAVDSRGRHHCPGAKSVIGRPGGFGLRESDALADRRSRQQRAVHAIQLVDDPPGVDVAVHTAGHDQRIAEERVEAGLECGRYRERPRPPRAGRWHVLDGDDHLADGHQAPTDRNDSDGGQSMITNAQSGLQSFDGSHHAQAHVAQQRFSAVSSDAEERTIRRPGTSVFTAMPPGPEHRRTRRRAAVVRTIPRAKQRRFPADRGR